VEDVTAILAILAIWRAACIEQSARCDAKSVHGGGVVPHPMCIHVGRMVVIGPSWDG
jgi:hypothetical protein